MYFNRQIEAPVQIAVTKSRATIAFVPCPAAGNSRSGAVRLSRARITATTLGPCPRSFRFVSRLGLFSGTGARRADQLGPAGHVRPGLGRRFRGTGPAQR